MHGTSAHRRIRMRAAGASAREALQAVVDFLVRETTANLAGKAE